MNEDNKNSFYLVNQDSGKTTFTKFKKQSDFEFSQELTWSNDGSESSFMSVLDTTNDWVLANVQYGPI